ncbi:hypothetical protein [Oricola sp.]|uniref:hypothetical protein n=1 Tax=Oricola sp. TaxID=1979950 RepID=UPI0025D64672|nr:hypothetical protein [Oricola sp.]MCI5078654.1 hypothetical protein [Oricola sp.]
MSNLDLSTLEIIRKSRLGFFDDICAASSFTDRVDVAKLRSDPVLYVSEFLYMISQFDFSDREFFSLFVENHNAYLVDLASDEEKYKSRLGLTRERIEFGRFTEGALRKSLANFKLSEGGLDQSDLSRFMTTVLAPETTRRTVKTLEEAQLVDRVNYGFGSIVIRSKGILEQAVETYLVNVRQGILGLTESAAA